MEIVRKRRALIGALCQEVGKSVQLIVKHCDALLEETNDSLNKKQIADLRTMHRLAQRTLSLADEISQAVLEDHLLTNREEFLDFLQRTFHEFRTPINVIVQFSRVTRDEITGTLSSEQKELLDRIHTLGETLLSSFNEYQIAPLAY